MAGRARRPSRTIRDDAALLALARDKGAGLAFLKLLKALILSSPDEALRLTRERKLLTLTHDQEHLRRLDADLRSWASTAPLSKRVRRRLGRHLDVCREMQNLFSTIDVEASASRVWVSSRSAVILALLGAVEEYSDGMAAQFGALEGMNAEPTRAFEGHAAVVRMHRDHCDAILTVAQQASRRCPVTGADEVKEEDLAELVTLADLYDKVSGAFDCYSYYGWQVLLRGSEMRLVPTMGEFDRARDWAGLRVHSADAADRHGTGATIQSFLERHSTSADIGADTGGWAVDSPVWQDAHAIAGEWVTRVYRAVNDLFDPDEALPSVTGAFTVREYLSIWQFVACLVLCERATRRAIVSSGRTCRVPTYSVDERDALAARYLRIDEVRAQSLLALVTTDVRQGAALDLFYTPFIRLDSGSCALAMSYADTSRVDRNLFALAAARGGRHLSVRGFRPIAKLQATFRKAAFSCVANVPIRAEGRTVTDLDLAIVGADILFLAQAKVAVQPDSPHEIWSIRQKLEAAAEQLAACLESRAALVAALTKAGLHDAPDAVSVVPFLLTNVWQFTGTRIRKFPVVDVSYLHMLLRGGVVTEIYRNRVTPFKLIEGGVPSAVELRRWIRDPVHRAMFRTAPDETAELRVGSRVLLLPLRTRIELPPTPPDGIISS